MNLFLQVETDFLASGDHFFFHFETLQLLPSVFFRLECRHTFKRIPVGGKRFSGEWNRFFTYFSDISARDSFCSSSGNVLWKRILHSGQWKRIFWQVETNFFPFFVKAFSVYCKLIFQQILHSGQWKMISGQQKPLCSNISNIPSTGSSFSISCKYILNESLITASGNGFSVQLKRYSLIHKFQKPLLQLEGGQYLRKNLLFLLEETVFFNLFRY